ncbi:DUF6670 family protein [Acinetobacter chinensis]|uniref:DUF6670 family protein n=1 Tax=Acinetobacter chinensis TaxID=2004650 RepID=UPI002934D77D|nr:DUF6670 family protein [Acinetobacter chinensis]WOE41985.1 hypothetical protein QSG87_02225 [Acinetobacter chinensis]
MFNKKISDRFIKYIYPLIDATKSQENKAFPQNYKLLPYTHSKKIGWTHFGVMIPDLPAPHHFYSVMSIIGTAGALAFDNDHTLKDTPRNNATLVVGTGTKKTSVFAGYSIPKECQFAKDSSHIQFGNDLTITGHYPHYQLHSGNENYQIDLDLKLTDKITWFVKTPFYDHISLLAEYSGTLQSEGQSQEISGLCTFEHAAAISPHLIWKKALKQNLKLPLDFFTYQIINLADGTQLLLNDTRINGTQIVSKAFFRSLTQYNKTCTAEFKVIEYQEDLATAPDGKKMKLPQVFEWRIYEDQQEILYLHCTVNTEFNYGLGSGYVGGYAYTGMHKSKEIQGQGYIEYIDRMES